MKRTFLENAGRALMLLSVAAGVHAATTDLANVPLVTSSTSAVRPNLMFVLDDSGSMGWDFMPDWANVSDQTLFRNSGFNGVAYNPAVVYNPPIVYNADGSIDTATYPSMTTFTSVKDDGYGVQSTSSSNLVGNAYFYTFIAGEYCDKPNLRNCVTQTASTPANPYPGALRWCTSSAMTACQAVWINSGTTYNVKRYPISATASVDLSGTSATTVSGITVDTGAGAKQILSAAIASSTSTTTIGNAMATNINACTAAITGSCAIAGYSASYNSGTGRLTITAPAGSGSVTATPVISKTGTMIGSPTAFSGGVPGYNLRTDIVSGTGSYPYPGTAAKATTRTDCTGATCTYTEEMTNYANWWAYYHTRMQMMKTSVSLAFQTVGSTYRVGYATINANQTNAFLNLDTFDITQKRSWYSKLFAALPNSSTPLRASLSKIGRLYAGKLNGTSFDGVTVVDPMQYSCQQNFTILSTDGFWNESSGYYKIDGSTNVGSQDSSEPRPYNDGGGSVVTDTTPTVSTSVSTTPRTVVDRSTRTDTTTTTDTRTRTDTYTRTRLTSSGSDSCSNPNNTRQRTYSGSVTTTETTTTTVTQPKELVTTTGFSDAATTTTTSTRSVVTTNGVVTSDTTLTTTTGPTTVTSTTSGPTTVTNNLGAATTTVTGPTEASSPAATVAAISWGSSLTDTCIATTSNSDTLAIASSGAYGAITTAGPTTTTGGLTHTGGYPQTTFGATTTVATGPTTGATTTTTVTSGGTSNTLADVSEYYYVNDLRTSALGNCTGAPIPPAVTGIDVCTNDVPSSGLDAASWQHMTSFTLGLGAAGYMQFASNYTTATSGDYFDVKSGTPANPAGGICSWQGSGACNWPAPVSGQQTTIDDLWHAAVNGRGTYFSATNPASLNAGLSSALSGVSTRTGSSAAATTSNPNVTSGDNFVFSSTFTTQDWDGELVRQQLDLVSGAVSATEDWAARDQLDANVSRTLYTYDGAAADKLKPFAWANLTAAQQLYFLTPNISGLSQFCVTGVTCLSAADQITAAGANLVNFLRGDRTNEGISTDTTKYYRARSHILGDIVNAEAVYVKIPLHGYADVGYSAYITAQASRQGMVYVAANDGMLHAFNSTTGAEAFTYVPTMILPNLYKLADKNYTALHQYFVDGTPVAGDVYFGSAWHTIVVGGLNGGGRGYYALDVTDPAAPKALWEFTDTNLGYTYGNPTITKLGDGTWVVLVTSGYNNVSPGDGVGRLYVLNAGTGALIREISTGVGSVATPSGLARISAWVENTTADNTALRAYGGDMLGNLWRFDINDNVGASGYDAQRLTTLYTSIAGTVTQPITTRPELGVCGGEAVVFVGTGRYLGTTDLTDTSLQSFYAVKDSLGSTALVNPKGGTSTFVNQSLTNTTCPAGSPATICTTGQSVRTSSSNTVNFAVNDGWYIDLPDSGERANNDPTLALGTLGWTTNIPNTSACTAGGYSYRYLVNYCTGAPVSTSTTGVTAIKLGNALSTRGVFVRLPNNTVVQLTRLSDGTTLTTNVPIGTGIAPTRRVSWRELIQDQ